MGVPSAIAQGLISLPKEAIGKRIDDTTKEWRVRQIRNSPKTSSDQKRGIHLSRSFSYQLAGSEQRRGTISLLALACNASSYRWRETKRCLTVVQWALHSQAAHLRVARAMRMAHAKKATRMDREVPDSGGPDDVHKGNRPPTTAPDGGKWRRGAASGRSGVNVFARARSTALRASTDSTVDGLGLLAP